MANITVPFCEIISQVESLAVTLPKWHLPVSLMASLPENLREYAAFGLALNECRKVAYQEFAYVNERISEIKAIGKRVTDTPFPETDVETSTPLSAADEEKENFQSLYNDAKRQYDEFRDAFIKEFTKLALELHRTTHDAADFKVVLFGRTQVGKSTIREALTCGDGATIGQGNSSTTKTCHEYTWRNLHVWDTPGIDSRKDVNRDETGIGDEERAANEKLETADIAVFVCKTDSLEEREREKLAQIVKSTRPYVILLNVVASFTDYANFKKRHSDQKINRNAQHEFIEDLIAPHPDAERNLIPIHALACFYSRARNSEAVDAFYKKYGVSRAELYALSNFGEFRQYLTRFICERGVVERRKTIDHVFIEKVRAFFESQKTLIDCFIKDKIENEQEIVNRSRGELARKGNQWSSATIKARLSTLLSAGVNTYAIAKQCIENGWEKETIHNYWDRILKQAVETVSKQLGEEFEADISHAMENMEDALKFNSEAFSKILEVEDAGGDGRKTMKLISRIAGWGGAVLFIASNWWNPAGWVVTVATLLSGLSLGFSLVSSFFRNLFKSKETKTRELKEKFDDNLRSASENLCCEMEMIFTKAIDKIDVNLNSYVEKEEQLKQSLLLIVDACNRAGAVCNAVELRMKKFA